MPDWCYSCFVQIRLTIFRVLAAFALLGILLTPLARPAMAASGMASAVSHQEMTMDAADGHTAVAGDMSCCPDEVPPPDCAKYCLMMTCAAGALSMLAAPSWQFLPELADVDPSLRPDGMRSGISITPPPKPPKA